MKSIKSIFRHCFGLVFVGAVASSFAADNEVVPQGFEYQLCLDEAMSVAVVNRCIESELKKQDRKLNQAYKALRADLSVERRIALRDVQRAWIKYRDKKCSFYYHSDSGSGGLTDMMVCELSETVSRTVELKEFLPQ